MAPDLKIVKFKKLNEDATLPVYATLGASGMDIKTIEEFTLVPGERHLFKTGIALAEMDYGLEIQVRPRSGLALKKGLSVINTPGTIDADYRGEIGIVLINHGDGSVKISKGDRIAQLVVAPVVRVEACFVENTTETTRGEGGFGSTGL